MENAALSSARASRNRYDLAEWNVGLRFLLGWLLLATLRRGWVKL